MKFDMVIKAEYRYHLRDVDRLREKFNLGDVIEVRIIDPIEKSAEITRRFTVIGIFGHVILLEYTGRKGDRMITTYQLKELLCDGTVTWSFIRQKAAFY